MERAVLYGRTFVVGESIDLKMTLFAAPVGGGRRRQRAVSTLNDIGSDPATLVPDIEVFLDTNLPENEDPA
jgi:hypothetical protein